MKVFKNLNDFPIIIPGKRGSSITVRPGEQLTDPWFSRFVGPRQLSCVDSIDISDAVPLLISSSEQVTWLEGQEVVREGEWYQSSRGLWMCKKCGAVRTSLVTMHLHLTAFHEVGESGLEAECEELCSV